jgi:hypothetical protein
MLLRKVVLGIVVVGFLFLAGGCESLPEKVVRGTMLELLQDRGAYWGTDGEGKFLIPHPDFQTVRSGARVEVLGSMMYPSQDQPIFRVRTEGGKICWLVIPERGRFFDTFRIISE